MRPRFFHLLFYVRLHLSFSLSCRIPFLFLVSFFEFLSSPVLNTILGDDIFILSDYAKITTKKDEAIKITKQLFLFFRLWLVNFYFYLIFFLFGWRDFSMSIDTFFVFFTRKLRFPIRLVFFSSFSKVSDSQPHTLKYFFLVIFISFLSLLFFFILLFYFVLTLFLLPFWLWDESAVRESVWLKWIE